MNITNIEVKPNGEKWGYVTYNRQWVMLDGRNNIIREFINKDGHKVKYFDLYGYQPHTFKEHLDKDGNADPYAQQEYCKSVNCPDCYYCVWVSHMHLPPNPNKKKEEKVITREQPKEPKKTNKWDRLAQAATINRVAKEDDHPLLDYILKKFNGRIIND